VIDLKLIEELTEIANRKEIIDKSESHVSFPFEIKSWMTVRILNAIERRIRDKLEEK